MGDGAEYQIEGNFLHSCINMFELYSSSNLENIIFWKYIAIYLWNQKYFNVYINCQSNSVFGKFENINFVS